MSADPHSNLLQVGEALGKAKGNEIKAIAGKLTDAETLISAKVNTGKPLVTVPVAFNKATGTPIEPAAATCTARTAASMQAGLPAVEYSVGPRAGRGMRSQLVPNTCSWHHICGRDC